MTEGTTERPDRGARAFAEPDPATLYNGAAELASRLAVITTSDGWPKSVVGLYPFARAILANGAVFLPDAAELERLRRIEAALDAVMESRSSYGRPLTDYMEFGVAAEARAALGPEGSAQG